MRHDGRELWLINAHVSTYDPASRQNHDPLRPRKLLLHRKEIAKMYEKISSRLHHRRLDIHLAKGRAKVTIALAKGKKQYDKRQTIAKRDSQRDMASAIGRRLKGNE